MKQFIFLFLITLSLSAQVKGVVKDSISGKPIAYVNIWVENENIGTTSEENGTFSLNIKEDKNIVFSALGYETKTIKSGKINTVSLFQKTIQLDEIVVENRKNTKEIEIGGFKKGRIKLYYGSGIKPTILAKKIEFTEEVSNYPFLKEINFLSLCQIKKAKIILRFFELDNNGLPGADYLGENIIIEVKEGKNINKIDLEKYHIKIPEKGIFIAFEWMIIEDNKYTFEYTIEQEKK